MFRSAIEAKSRKKALGALAHQYQTILLKKIFFFSSLFTFLPHNLFFYLTQHLTLLRFNFNCVKIFVRCYFCCYYFSFLTFYRVDCLYLFMYLFIFQMHTFFDGHTS